jgi:hypothetical protein
MNNKTQHMISVIPFIIGRMRVLELINIIFGKG